MKRWRQKHRDDSMQPVIDICAKSMFELIPNMGEFGDKLIVFCDSRRDEGRLIPDIGDASDESPFRMGLTCTSLLEAYINIQQDPRCPIDMVKHLDQCRIGFLAKKTKFASVTEASKRLKAHYNKLKKQGKQKATALQPVGDLRHQLVVVRHEIPGPLQNVEDVTAAQIDDRQMQTIAAVV
ncbi:hypothetical protein GQ600_7799 [Phytophthora cactorum]|nr:hypothetical protein GQ600_7799 [Phytophthora cactorum]